MNKKYIIKDTREFTYIINKKNRVGNEFFTIYINQKKEPNNRFGITVPKKVGNAVTRNSIKRKTKEIIRIEEKYFELENDCIIIIKDKCVNAKFEDLKDGLIKLLNKIK